MPARGATSTAFVWSEQLATYDFGPRKGNDFGLFGQLMNGAAHSVTRAMLEEARFSLK